MPANTSQEAKTTPKQDAFIQALLAGNTIVTAASVAGCNEKTAHQWLKLPHVQTAYREAQHQLFDESILHIMSDIDEARTTLKAIMKDENASPSVRVRAAQIILEQAIEAHKVTVLETKIAELEELVKERNG